MVCDRGGCSRCLVLIGVVESVEWSGGAQTWSSTGASGYPGVWGAGIIAKGPVDEHHWAAERANRWVCSWECFDRWAKTEAEANGPPTEEQGHVTLGGVRMFPEAAERLRGLANH